MVFLVEFSLLLVALARLLTRRPAAYIVDAFAVRCGCLDRFGIEYA